MWEAGMLRSGRQVALQSLWVCVITMRGREASTQASPGWNAACRAHLIIFHLVRDLLSELLAAPAASKKLQGIWMG